jgi:hypothetical protein
MTRVFTLVFLVVIFGCEPEDERPLLKFQGEVVDGATSMPVPNVWVRINLFSAGLRLVKTDSALTNASGYYSFKLRDPGAMRYILAPQEDYRSLCYGRYQPALLGVGKSITAGQQHTDVVQTCRTGIVKLNIAKLNPAAKDTLSIFVMIGGIQTHAFKVSENKEMKFPFYADRLGSVTFQFAARRENGEFPVWSRTEAIVPEATRVVDVSF